MESVGKEIDECKPKNLNQTAAISLSKASIAEVSRIIAKSIGARIAKDVNAQVSSELTTNAVAVNELPRCDGTNNNGAVGDSLSELINMHNFMLNFGKLKLDLANVNSQIKNYAVEAQSVRNEMTAMNYQQKMHELELKMETLRHENELLKSTDLTNFKEIAVCDQKRPQDDTINTLQAQLDNIRALVDKVEKEQLSIHADVDSIKANSERTSNSIDGMRPLLKDLLQNALQLQAENSKLKKLHKQNHDNIETLKEQLAKQTLEFQAPTNKLQQELARLQLKFENDPKFAIRELPTERIYRAEISFQYTVQNIAQLVRPHTTPPFYVRMLSWKIQLVKDAQFLNINFSSGGIQAESWSCIVDVQITLNSHLPDAVPRSILKFRRRFLNDAKLHHTAKVISFDELLDPQNGYVQNNSITLNVSVSAEEPKGVVLGYFSHK